MFRKLIQVCGILVYGCAVQGVEARSVGSDHHTLAVHGILFEAAFVALAVGPNEDTLAATLAVTNSPS